jgi:DNA polymerase-3 subunit beta
MKLVVNSIDFANAISKVSKAVATKATQPVLEGIKFKAKNDELTLTATDLEISIEATVACDVLEEGECVVGKLIAEWVAKLETNSMVDITEEKNRLKFKCADNDFAVSTLPAKDYPLINKEIDESTSSFEIEVANLKQAIAETTFCCATDEARPILKGALIEVDDGKMTMVALDGFRMAKAVKPCVSNGKIKCVVPARSLQEMVKLIGNEETKITVFVQPNNIAIKTNGTIFTSRLLTGAFVNYETLLVRSYDTTATVKKDDMVAALERVSIVSKTNQNIVKVNITNKDIKLSASSQAGDIMETTSVEKDGKDIELYINYKYLYDCVKACITNKVQLFIKDKQSPIVLANGKNEYLILPIIVNN